MKKRLIGAGICLAILIAAGFLILEREGIAARVQSILPGEVLLIDPGHGGIDGGAESSRGVVEKSINLAIAQEVQKLARQAGWQVVMTRETDEGLYEEGGGSIRSKKTQDLKARRELIRAMRPEAAVSIHLNSFREDTSVKGAQAFYPVSGGSKSDLTQSKKLAEILQEKVSRAAGEKSSRPALSKSDVFLFREVSCPISIIECGFLSNPKEAELLQNSEYQKKIAEAIFEGIMEFTGKEPRKKIPVIENKKEGDT